MEYTKGEWKLHLLRQRDGLVYRLAVTSDSGFSPIGEIYANNEKQEANAHLIAAAPALYEACKDFIATMQMSHNYKSFEVAMKPIVSHIQQALTKVETKNATIK